MQERHASPLVHAVSALFAGAVSTSLTHPLDLLKARLQVQHIARNSELKYRGTWHGLRVIFKQEGLAGLYRGVTPNIVGNAAAWGLYMWSYTWLKEKTQAGSIGSLGLAMCAGAVTQVFTNPIWLVKLRLQSQPHDAQHRYAGMIDAFRVIYREEGFKGFWRGMVPALIGTSHGAVQIVSYEKMREIMIDQVENKHHMKVGSVHYFWLGVASKMAATVMTFPYQLVKARMQVRDVDFVRHTSFIGTIKSVWANEGFAGFYRGVVPASIRMAPHAAIMFASYEGFRSIISQTKL